jgi:hypothetical protein
VLAKAAAQKQALEQLLAAQQDPKSPQYHHWLTWSEAALSDSDRPPAVNEPPRPTAYCGSFTHPRGATSIATRSARSRRTLLQCDHTRRVRPNVTQMIGNPDEGSSSSCMPKRCPQGGRASRNASRILAQAESRGDRGRAAARDSESRPLFPTDIGRRRGALRCVRACGWAVSHCTECARNPMYVLSIEVTQVHLPVHPADGIGCPALAGSSSSPAQELLRV